MFFFIKAWIKLLLFFSERCYREIVHIFWIDRKYEKEVCDRGAAYVHQLIRNLSEGRLNEIDPIHLKDQFIGFEASLASIKIDGEMEVLHVNISGLSSLKMTDSCSLTKKDNLLHVNANIMAGPLSFDSLVVFRFLGLEQKFLVKGSLGLIEFLCKFTVTPKEENNGLFESLYIRNLKGMKLWIQEGPWLLKSNLNFGITLVMYLLKPFVRNGVECLLEYWFVDVFSKYNFPIELSSSKSSKSCSTDLVCSESETSDSFNRIPLNEYVFTHSDSGKSESFEKESEVENESSMTEVESQLIHFSSEKRIFIPKTTTDLFEQLFESEPEKNLVKMENQLKKNINCSPIKNGYMHKNSLGNKEEHYETAKTPFNERDENIGKLFEEVGNRQNDTYGLQISNMAPMKMGDLRKTDPSCDMNQTLKTVMAQFIERHDETKKLFAEVQNQLKNETKEPSITNGYLHNVSSSGKKNLKDTTIEFMKQHDEVNKLWEDVKRTSRAVTLDSDETCRIKKDAFSKEFLKFVPIYEDRICPYREVCPYQNVCPNESLLESRPIALGKREFVTELEMVERKKQDKTFSNDEIPATGNFEAKNVEAPSKRETEESDTLRKFFNNSLTVRNESKTYNNIVTLDNENGTIRKLESVEKKNDEKKLLEVEKDTSKSSLKRCSETLLEHSSKSRKRFPGSSTNETKYREFLESIWQPLKLSNSEEMHEETNDLRSPNKAKGSNQVSNSIRDAFADLLSYSDMPKYRSSNCIAAENNRESNNSKNNENKSINYQNGFDISPQLYSREDQFLDTFLYSATMPKSRGSAGAVAEKNLASNEREMENLNFSKAKDGRENRFQQRCYEDQFFDLFQYSAMMPKSIHSTDVLEISINEPDQSGDEQNIIESTEDGCLKNAEFSSPSKDPLASLLIYSTKAPKSEVLTNDVEAFNRKLEPVALMQNETKRKETIKPDVITGVAENCSSITMDLLNAPCAAEVSSKENSDQESQPNAENNKSSEAKSIIEFYKMICDVEPQYIADGHKQLTASDTLSQVKFSSLENNTTTPISEDLVQENPPNNEKTDTTHDAVSGMDIHHQVETKNVVAATIVQNGMPMKETVEREATTGMDDISDYSSMQTSNRVAICAREVSNKEDNSHEDPIKKEMTEPTHDAESGTDIYVDIEKRAFARYTRLVPTEVKQEKIDVDLIRLEDAGDYFSMNTSNEEAILVEISKGEEHFPENMIKKETTFVPTSQKEKSTEKTFDVHREPVEESYEQLVGYKVIGLEPNLFSELHNGVNCDSEVSSTERCAQYNLEIEAAMD